MKTLFSMVALAAGVLLATLVFAVPGLAQSASDASAQVRPLLEDQIHWRYRKPTFCDVHPHARYCYCKHHRGDDECHDGPGRRPDVVDYVNCADSEYALEEVIANASDNATIRIEGSGPACTLTEPLRLTRSIRITGAAGAVIIGPASGPCMYAAGASPNGTWPAITIDNLKFYSFSGYRDGCIRSDNANLTLNFVDVDASGVDVLSRGGRLTISGGRLKGGEDESPALAILGSEFTVARTKFDTVGSPIYIQPPGSGPATLAQITLYAKGKHAYGIRMRRHEHTPWGSLVVLDRVRVRGFDRGVIIGKRVRAMAADIKIFESAISGLDVNGALIMTGSRIMYGGTGVRLGHHAGRAQIEGNYIMEMGVAGLDVQGHAPAIVRDNVFAVAGRNCFVGEHADRFKRDNRCTEARGPHGPVPPNWEDEDNGPPRGVAAVTGGHDVDFDAEDEEAHMSGSYPHAGAADVSDAGPPGGGDMGDDMDGDDEEPGGAGQDTADDDNYPSCVTGVDAGCRPWQGSDDD